MLHLKSVSEFSMLNRRIQVEMQMIGYASTRLILSDLTSWAQACRWAFGYCSIVDKLRQY